MSNHPNPLLAMAEQAHIDAVRSLNEIRLAYMADSPEALRSNHVPSGWLENFASRPPAEQVRIVCLALAGAVWLAAMAMPAGENIHSNIEDMPYLLIGLVLWAGAQVAHWLGANIRFYWFFSTLLVLASWF